jgi:hypothetical protein
MIVAEAFEDVLHPVVELSQKSGCGRLLTHRRVTLSDVCLERDQLLHGCFHGL